MKNEILPLLNESCAKEVLLQNTFTYFSVVFHVGLIKKIKTRLSVSATLFWTLKN